MANGLLYQKIKRLIDEDEFLKDIREETLARRICDKFRLNKKEAKQVFNEINLPKSNRFRVRRR